MAMPRYQVLNSGDDVNSCCLNLAGASSRYHSPFHSRQSGT